MVTRTPAENSIEANTQILKSFARKLGSTWLH